jgi:hypothetical protein
MIEVDPERLLEISRELAGSGERWHNHVLSPDCKLNERRQCALIVEASDRQEVYVTYSDEPMMDVGRAIATMVHGEDPLAAAVADPGEKMRADSAAVAEMMRRAEDFASRGIHWHHHILFPECVFNPHPGDWTLVFEDPETGETLESVTAEKPEQDIRVTETMFFSQTVHS